MATTEVSPGIHHIVLFDTGGAQYLTKAENRVTILPPGARPPPEQDWRIIAGKDGNFIIEHPTGFFPSSYLTYQGAPGEPKEGERVLLRISDFPLNEWHFVSAGDDYFYIRVAGSELGIGLGPELIFPPVLILSLKDQLKWKFTPGKPE